MKRSVIQLAGRTLLVSLPAKWADANNVKKGDELEIVEDGHRLVVNTEQKSSVETAELNADIPSSLIKRYLFALYKKGIDEIKITFSDPKVVEIIRDTILNETVGYEIVSQTPKSCVVKLITSGGMTEFDNLLRRVFLLLLSMSEEAFDTIKKKEFDHLLKTALLEKTNNRLTTVCRRSLNKWGTDTYSKTGPVYYIVEELENVADEYKYLCYNLNRNGKKSEIRPEVLALLDRANKMFRTFYELFYSPNPAKYMYVLGERVDFIEKVHNLMDNKKINSAENYIIHHSTIIMDKVFCMMGPFLVLAK